MKCVFFYLGYMDALPFQNKPWVEFKYFLTGRSVDGPMLFTQELDISGPKANT